MSPCPSEESDELRATKTFEITATTNSPEQGRAMIAQGTARVGLMIPPDFHDKRAKHENAQFLVLIDGSDSNYVQISDHEGCHVGKE